MDSIFSLHTSVNIYGNELLKLSLSIVVGAILGIEREIRGKAAGFRTLTLICFGATIFTMCSYLLGVTDNRDRLAANIITGIGFIGAGVIFRTNSSISGITTAASIWVAAAIGMLLGIGEYLMAAVSLLFTLFILYALDFLQFWLDDRYEHRNYKIVFRKDCEEISFRNQAKSLNLNVIKPKMTRIDTQVTLEFEISGKESNLSLFNKWLIENQSILSVDW